MKFIDRIQSVWAETVQTWHGFGQIAPLALGFAAGLATTLVL